MQYRNRRMRAEAAQQGVSWPWTLLGRSTPTLPRIGRLRRRGGGGLARGRAPALGLARRRRHRLGLGRLRRPGTTLALDPVEQDARQLVLLLEPLGRIRNGLDALDQQQPVIAIL